MEAAAAERAPGRPPPPPEEDELSVRVAVRLRPLLPAEQVGGAQTCIRPARRPNEVVLGKGKGAKRFTFDAAFAEDAPQDRVFDEMALPLVNNVFEGYNATLLAYGQTGSGKTFTMGSSNKTVGFDAEVGMIPRVVRSIFDRLEESDAEADGEAARAPEFLMRASFIEIYNEELKDLLNPSTSPKDISIREDADGSIVVAGVKEQVVSSYEETMRCIEGGCVTRTTATTAMNDQSSRSHAIFTLIYERVAVRGGGEPNEGAPAEYITSKFHLVDLAGSERNKRTKNVGGRFKESVAINYGLLALGNVISALGDEKKRGRVTHVPYRESKLTRILQDSLGGNSNTAMIACVSPADNSFTETLNTLKYANRARNIKNKPIVNRDSKNVQLKQLRSRLQSLQMELLRASGASGEPAAAAAVQTRIEAMLRDQSSAGHVKQLLAQVGQVGGEGEGSELGQVLLQRVRELEAEHTQAKAALLTAENNVVELSEMCLQMRSHARTAQQKVAAARAQCEAQVDAGNQDFVAVLEALPTDLEMRVEVADAWAARASGEERQLPTVRNALSPARASSGAGTPTSVGDESVSAADGAEVVRLRAELQEARDDAATLRSELEEANSDLQRDERIFNEKMRLIDQLEQDNAELRQAASDAPAKLAESMTSQPAALPPDMYASPAPGARVGTAGSYSSVAQTPQSARVLASMAEDDDDVMLMGEDDESFGTLPTPFAPDKAPESELATLESEKAALFREKSEIEEEKQQIEMQANFDKRRYHVNKQRMEKTLMDLQVNIRLKEDLISELSKNEHDAKDKMQAQYEEQMAAIAADRDAKHAELAKLQNELAGLEGAVLSEAEAKSEELLSEAEAKNEVLRRQMMDRESKVKSLQGQIHELEQAQKDQKKVLHAKLLSERQVAKLTDEIEKMRSRSNGLKSKLRDNKSQHERDEKKHEKELNALRKETEGFAKQIRQLERENSKQRQRLKAKEEEVVRLASRRRSHPQGSRPATAPQRGSVGASARSSASSKSRDKDQDAVLSQAVEEGMRKRLADQKAMLDTEVEKHLGREEATQRLEKELAQREAAIAEKEAALAERHALELRRMRNSHSVNESMVEVNTRLETLQEQLEQGNFVGVGQGSGELASDPLSASVAGRKAEAELSALRLQQEHAYRERAELEQRAKSRQFLSSQDEQLLFELEDRVETLDAQIEYKSSTIREAEAQLAQHAPGGGQDPIDSSAVARVMQAASPEARLLMEQYIGEVVKLKQAEAEAGRGRLLAEQHAQEREAQVEELENFLRQQELELDRQLTQQAKEHELKTQYLLKQIKPQTMLSVGSSGSTDTEKVMRMKDEQISLLEKDVFYYKHKKKELEAHVKDIVEAGDATLQRYRTDERELSSLRQVNRNLMSELSNTKAYLQQLGPASQHQAHAIRISKSQLQEQLRPLSREELQSRRGSPG